MCVHKYLCFSRPCGVFVDHVVFLLRALIAIVFGLTLYV